MATIRIEELEVYYRIGVPDEERAQPQRLMVCVEMEIDSAPAELSDDVRQTVDYYEVAQWLLHFGEGRSWKLLERLAAEIADRIMSQFQPQSARVEVKKYIIPEARHVSVSCRRPA